MAVIGTCITLRPTFLPSQTARSAPGSGPFAGAAKHTSSGAGRRRHGRRPGSAADASFDVGDPFADVLADPFADTLAGFDGPTRAEVSVHASARRCCACNCGVTSRWVCWHPCSGATPPRGLQPIEGPIAVAVRRARAATPRSVVPEAAHRPTARVVPPMAPAVQDEREQLQGRELA